MASRAQEIPGYSPLHRGLLASKWREYQLQPDRKIMVGVMLMLLAAKPGSSRSI